ncbi:hypothetical protein [Paractinoplanes rishiriensis]|uniref:DUF5666 domain-containing protein n=1 Tax=Paractinoplanes rishiriensis TaxID=1050105 RepID=A0A919N289_9ACTN|nr:hypothetical protein [Actinoplanes rishiriensis]GIE98917.1 hypothetical protein Ari01nite_63820 [Actinoplanes rishiriensis]
MTDTDTEVIPAVDDDLSTALAAAAPRRWSNRATPLLLGLALLAGGFLGGVTVQKQFGGTRTSDVPVPPGATAGTLQTVGTDSLTIRTTTGRTVVVKIAPDTRLQRPAVLTDLRTGQPVTVQGSTATDGTIAATVVSGS